MSISESLQRRGVSHVPELVNGRIVNSFKNSFGTDVYNQVDSVMAAGSLPAPVSLRWSDYYITKSVIEKAGISDISAEVFALIFVSIAKARGISVRVLVDQIVKKDRMALDLEMYVLFNLFRSPSEQQNFLYDNDNRSSYRRKNIVA